MEIPTNEIRADGPLLDDIGAAALDASSICAYGRARGLPRLSAFHALDRLWLSGVSERQLAALPALPTLRRLVIHDYRAPSLAALPECPALESLGVCGSSKLKTLGGIERYPRLRAVILFACCNYTDLGPLRSLASLEELCLEGGFSKLLRVVSLEPLSGLGRLKRLRLASIEVEEGGLQPLTGLRGLESVFVARTFPDADLRRLADALPRARGEFLDSYRSAHSG